MYCPNCELEIKGEEKSQCPICNSPLIESPFETPAPADDMSDTELKLKELIRDIDEKVSKNLEESTSDQEFKLDNFNLDTSDPSEREFDLDLDSGKTGNHAESSDDQIFNLSEDQQEISSKPKEPVFDFADTGSSVNQKDIQEPSETITETPPDMQYPLEPAQSLSKKTPTTEIDDTVEIARFNVKPAKEDVSTREILDQALNELETEEESIVKTKKKSFAMPVLVGSFLLAVVIGVGMYILNYKSAPVTVSPVNPPKKDSLVLKKTLPDVESKQAPAVEKQPLTHDNKTQAAAQTNVPSPSAIPVSEKTGIDKPLSQAATSALMKENAPQPTGLQPSDEKKEIMSAKESDQQKTTVTIKDTASLKEIPPEMQSFEQKEPEKIKKPAPQKASLKAIPGTFSVHAGSYRTSKTAEQEAQRLKERGFDAYSEKTDLGTKGIWYRIKIGAFSSRTDAEKILQQFFTREQQEARIIRNK